MKTEKEVAQYKELTARIYDNSPPGEDAFIRGFLEALKWVLEEGE